ncbi:MAG: FxLYD domain-containing protein [Candidatus Bathyarchaeia archaeon]
MKKKALLISFLIAVLVGCSTSIGNPHFAMAQSSDVSHAQVLSYNWYVAPSNTHLSTEPGDLVIVGEIQNVGSNIIGDASVEGTALDSGGNVLAEEKGTVFVFHMLPGQKAPFYIDFTPASGSTGDLSWVSSIKSVKVSVSSVTDTSAAQYSGLAIPFGGSVGSILNNNTYTVVGYIENNGTETAGDVWVVTTFYNAAGMVVALNFTSYLANSLAPGAEVPFWATPADNTPALSNEIANYTVQIDSLPSTSSTSTSTPSTSNRGFPTTTLVIAVVLVAVAAAAILALRKRQKSPLPPPPPPPPSTD